MHLTLVGSGKANRESKSRRFVVNAIVQIAVKVNHSALVLSLATKIRMVKARTKRIIASYF